MTTDYGSSFHDYKRQIKEASKKLLSSHKTVKNIEEAFRTLSEICNKDV